MSIYSDNENMSDSMAPPWWKAPTDDYTKRRSGALGYTMDDLIGRKDCNKFILTTSDPTTLSGSGSTLLIS